VAEFNVVSSDYFRTMRLPIVQGRAFDGRDGVGAAKVAMISESLARLCFGDKNPVGQPAWIARDTKGSPLTIVGVVRDVKQRDIREAPLPMLFLPATQSTAWEMNLLVRVRNGRVVPAADLRQAIAEVGRDVPIREITTPQIQLTRTLLQERVLATLSGFFGPLALLLATLGLYGLLAYHVACRTREIGVRAALGASTGRIVRFVLRRGLALLAIGTLLGGGGAILVAQTLRRFLFALSPYDPLVFGGSVGVLGVVGILACLVPARRAAKVNPIMALRHT
jgi:predicted permease